METSLLESPSMDVDGISTEPWRISYVCVLFCSGERSEERFVWAYVVIYEGKIREKLTVVSNGQLLATAHQ